MHEEDCIRKPVEDRLFGLARAAFNGYLTCLIEQKTGLSAKFLPMALTGSVLVTDGFGDLVSGDHHYIAIRLSDYFRNRGQKNAS